MNITILQGSPRKKGHTARIANWMEEEMRAAGHNVETISLAGKNLNGCLACAKCKEVTDAIGCIQKDDVSDIMETIVASDLVVFASPLYFWGVTAQLKAVIDRTYALYVNYHQPEHDSLVKGQKQALLLVGGGPYENNAEATVTAYQRLMKPHLSENVGELFIGGCKDPDNIGDDVREQAVAFARKISA